MNGFQGKVAIVTGGGSGLGEAIGKDLAAHGASVVLTDIDLERAERVAERFETQAERRAPSIRTPPGRKTRSRRWGTPSRPTGR